MPALASIYLPPGPHGNRDVSELLHYMAWRDLRTYEDEVEELLDEYDPDDHAGQIPVLALDYRKYVSDGQVTLDVLPWPEVTKWWPPVLQRGVEWDRWVGQVHSDASQGTAPAVVVFAPYMGSDSGPAIPGKLMPYTQITTLDWLQGFEVSSFQCSDTASDDSLDLD